MDLLNDLNDMKFDPYECFERNGCTLYGIDVINVKKIIINVNKRVYLEKDSKRL